MTSLIFSTAIVGVSARARSHRETPAVVCSAVAYGLAVYLAITLTRNSTNVAAIWPANAFLLGRPPLLAARDDLAPYPGSLRAFQQTVRSRHSRDGDPWLTVGRLSPPLALAECLLAVLSLRYAFRKARGPDQRFEGLPVRGRLLLDTHPPGGRRARLSWPTLLGADFQFALYHVVPGGQPRAPRYDARPSC